MLDVGTRIDDTELMDLLHDSKRDMKKAMRLGFGRAMTETKRKTQQYLKQALAPQRIGTSLDHEIETDGQGRVTALFGSRGPNLDGAIGVGIHTSPDDNEEQYNFGVAYNEGRTQRTIYWRSPRAAEHGREIGRKFSGTAWLPSEKFTFFGFPRLEYIEFAMDDFRERSPRIVKRFIGQAFRGRGGE